MNLLIKHTIVIQSNVLVVLLYATSYVYIRDWSLITARGGATKREGGGHVKFYPYEKEGGKSFSHAEGGSQKVLG